MTTERRLPTAYTRAVSMATEVFTGAPQMVDTSIPHVNDSGYGRGIQAQRRGQMTTKHSLTTGPDDHQGPAMLVV